ncbi:MAG: chromosome segregation protein SMC [Ignavibacteria bacterium GWB2_35_6b]|nr:MAG: chromosome segregation protein SMC [Ignavibacteria bacterium GWB2_35_6b]
MHLSKLEIFGFKSFANKTGLSFSRGITGIVGPNGCGKTNIVDAIRWCLGEQKSSTLRSDKMENVIFNGTRNKKPMGMAEVSITFLNDDGKLPSEYTEVTITRRIFRSGESEYLLNKNICRLKDITNLFMDTGMGTNAYSVIELKMIETILSSKAEERRRMFEEAAGVNKYKLRRRLALKKLDEVKADLTRVNDIVSEVEKNVRSLERQAKKADKYNQVQSVLREKELDLAEREFSLYVKNKNEEQQRIEEYTQRKDQVDIDIRKIENELIVFRTQINQVDSELRQKRSEIFSHTEKLHTAQRNISVSEERLKSLESNLDRFKKELEELHFQIENAEDSIVENQNKLDEFSSAIQKAESGITTTDDTILQKRNDVEEKRQQLKNYNDEVLKVDKEVSSKQNLLGNSQKALAKADENVDRLNQRIQKITNDIAKTVGYLEDLTNEKTQAENKFEESEKIYSDKLKEKERLEKYLSELKNKELDEKSMLNALKDKIDFLQTLITNLEGVSKGSKVLMENSNWTGKEKTLFADVGNTEEKYRFAMEAALKTVLNNLLIENFEDLQKASAYLKNNDLGKASFYLLNGSENGKKTFIDKLGVYSLKRKAKKIEKEESFLEWTLALVKTDSKWKPYFRKVLANTAVVNSLEAAIDLSHKYPGYNFTTLEGDIVQSSGIVEAGSSPKQDETLFGRKQLLVNLKKDFPKYQENLEKLKEEIELTEEQISSIDLKTLSEQGKLILNDITNLEKQISQFEFEKKKASEEIDKAQQQIQEFAKESNHMHDEISGFNSQIEKLKEQKHNLDYKVVDFEIELKNFETDFNNLVEEYNQKKLELERLRGQLQNTENIIQRAKENKSAILSTIEKRESDISETSAEIELIKESTQDVRLELDELNFEKQKLSEQETEIENNLKGIKEEAAKFENELSKFRSERQEVSDYIHGADVKLNEMNFRLENLVEHIKEEYTTDLEFKEFEDNETFDFKERRNEVHGLKEQIKNLGPINLLAYSEYEEERERMEFLQNQRNDLVNSEKDLIKTINEINETAQNLFAETFMEIKANFQKIFRTLFDPGDEADLIIEEGIDPLEAKIEIIAKPKGKRPTSIELLSGGEKTLTATALLFAIYLVKPSPFCILDEVDAPLDDANVDRFTKLIKEFSVQTQFIIVTHNKRTMESSQNMYGVTMQEEGISKLAGVHFDEEVTQN